MNTKHTPGPWMYAGAGAIKRDYTAIGCTDGETIASAWGHSNSGFFVSEEEKEANARLIAAAPELFEALLDMVSDHADLSEATLNFARAAIEKATGASHVSQQ